MALINCSECGTEVSDRANSCPKCGAPIAKSPDIESSSTVLGIVSVGLGLGAVLMPYFAAVFLVPAAIICGVIAIRKSQKVLGTVGTILGLIGVAGIIYTSNQIMQITSAIGGKSSEFSLPQSFGSEPPIVTRSEYDQIREGMSYSEVKAIIGASGVELSRSDIAGYSTVMYSWTNSDGSNMNAMFQNGGLVNKAQFGLP